MKVNRNFFVSKLFADELSKLGIKNCCISPGSRSTPLTLAFALQKRIRKYICIDERTSGFFALGLTQAERIPSVIICTSGTATVEFYPAIVEAYKNNFPLIVITADRPKGMSHYGASQTINQIGIYKNHIGREFNIEVTNAEPNFLKRVKDAALDCFFAAVNLRKPVHVNFHFDKPLEPNSYTDELDDSLIKEMTAYKPCLQAPDKGPKNFDEDIIEILKSNPNGLIIAGSDLFEKKTIAAINKFSYNTSYPILAEVTSNLKNKDCKNLVANIDPFLGNYTFPNGKPGMIIHFGKSTFSKGFENFLKNFNGEYLQINQYNDLFDPHKKVTKKILKSPFEFCTAINSIKLKLNNSGWLNGILDFDKAISDIKIKNLAQIKDQFEGRLYRDLIKHLPENCNIFLSNSLPIRDFNNFAGILPPRVTVYNNRGAAGIDGIISTALGINKGSGKLTVLVTGDLAFYYDISSLLIAKDNNIPLIIILVNNNGGGIFNTLPIAGGFDEFEKYFTTPLNIDFKKIVSAFGGNYFLINNSKSIQTALAQAQNSSSFSVIEYKTDSAISAETKKNLEASINSALRS
ncbi:MAG: 2-succinyl-5-enolpyruvyl-6-hydroxy-3-cyclohexene-1-carboxylic-acid synthase [Bacteroidota bacterium]|nr:2-succinyl-5-enolpyruvyl-6-hydroxy-3-cyclohexene-1-carboxylic-acid synthase [Bacteroidota bacterium]